MSHNDPATKADLQALKDFIREENRKLDNSIGKKLADIKKDLADIKKDLAGLKAEMRKDSSPVGAISV